jgi:hypothetical protein
VAGNFAGNGGKSATRSRELSCVFSRLRPIPGTGEQRNSQGDCRGKIAASRGIAGELAYPSGRKASRRGGAVAQPRLIRLIIRVTGDTIALSEKGRLESEKTMTRRRLFKSPALAIATLSVCFILDGANLLHAQMPYQPGGMTQPGAAQPGGVTQPGAAQPGGAPQLGAPPYQPGGASQLGAPPYQPGGAPQPGTAYQPGATNSYQPGAAYQPGIGGPYRPGSATTLPGAVYQPGYQPGTGTPYPPGGTAQPGAASPTGTR